MGGPVQCRSRRSARPALSGWPGAAGSATRLSKVLGEKGRPALAEPALPLSPPPLPSCPPSSPVLSRALLSICWIRHSSEQGSRGRVQDSVAIQCCNTVLQDSVARQTRAMSWVGHHRPSCPSSPRCVCSAAPLLPPLLPLQAPPCPAPLCGGERDAGRCAAVRAGGAHSRGWRRT